MLDSFHNPAHRLDGQAGIDPLRVEVQCQGHDIHVSGSLAITEQAALHAIRAGKQCLLGCGGLRYHDHCGG